MSEFKGTKGEFEMRGNRIFIKDTCKSIATIEVQKNYEDVTFKPVTDTEAIANGKLFACAPEMLNKLKETLDVLKWYMNNTDPQDNQLESFYNIGMNNIVAIDELIQKAT